MKARYSFLGLIVAAVLLAGCSKAPPPAAANPGANTPAAGMAGIQQAIQAFNKQEGHNPQSLDDLAPKYIPKIPEAPGGYKYVYDPATGEVKMGRK